MKVNLKKIMLSLEGEPIKIGDRDLTLGDVIKLALQGRAETDRDGWDQKLRRIDLAEKVHNAADTVELTAEQIILIKQWVGTMFSARVCGQVRDEIDPADKKIK